MLSGHSARHLTAMRRFAFLLILGLATTLTTHAANWSKALPLELKSRYFEFHYQRAGWDGSKFARFADAFVDLVSRDFIPMKFDYPIQVLVLPDKATFQQFLRREFVVKDPPN